MSAERALVLGIDPGLKGAYALYDLSARSLLLARDLPTRRRQKHTEIDGYAFAFELELYAARVILAVVEDVGGMTYVDKTGKRRGQGSQASFSFGRAAGAAIGVIECLQIPIRYAAPGGWKFSMGLSSNKDVSRERAATLFPSQADLFERKKDDGRAEAALLAYFGARGLASLARSEP